MSTKFSPLELHHFKTAVLAENRNTKKPAGYFPGRDDGELITPTPVTRMVDGNRQEVNKEDASCKINYIRHLNFFIAHLKCDDRLKPNHVSLYLALFYVWNCNHFNDHFKVNRSTMLQLSKIGSRGTYLECLKWLDTCGYITYSPGRQKFKSGHVSITTLSDASVSALINARKNGVPHGPDNGTCASTNTGPQNGRKNDTVPGANNESYTGPFLGHNINKQINNETESKQIHAPKKLFFNEKRAPAIEDVLQWFSQRGQTTQEARRFFFHYNAINWTISGQPITDWKSAAEKWSDRVTTIKNDKPGKLYTNDNKDYSHPL